MNIDEIYNELYLEVSSRFAKKSSEYATTLTPDSINLEVMSLGLKALKDELDTREITLKVLGKHDKGEPLSTEELADEIVDLMMERIKPLYTRWKNTQ